MTTRVGGLALQQTSSDDDAIPDVLAEHMGLELYSTIESPGDLMNRGQLDERWAGAFASELILEENMGGSSGTTFPNHSEGEIDQIVQAYHGSRRMSKCRFSLLMAFTTSTCT